MGLAEITSESAEGKIIQPLVMCRSKYDWIYREILPKGNCGKCSYDEGNPNCKNYKPVEILDFGRMSFMDEAMEYEGHN